MTHKKVDNSDAGTTNIFGGNDLDKWSDFASGVDVDDYDINCDFTVRSGKRHLRNPANTFSYTETASAIAGNRTITEPALLTNDVRVYENHLQQINSKTAGNWLKFTKQTTAPANQVTIDDIMLYNKQIDANNNGLFAKYKEAGAIVESRIGDLTATSTTTLTNKTISGATNTLTNIPVNSLSNFAISSPITDQIIQYNGTNWVNATAAASVTATSTTTFTNKTIGDF